MRVSVQASPRGRSSWLRLAREVEAAGLHALYAADHPGSTASPFVALAAAAAVTNRIRLGTCVVNAGLWEPVALASEAATLDVVSDGRTILGVGAGHTPHEWAAVGRDLPPAWARVGRMIEVVEATMALLAGESVSRRGRHVQLADAVMAEPRPVQDRVPLLVGGNGPRVLRFAAGHADVVGITGLRRTLPDGHRHEVDWREASVRRTVDAVLSTAAAAGRTPEIEALVQVVEITDDAARVADRLSTHIPGASAEDLLAAPFAWIGTVDEIDAKLRRCEEDLAISRYVVRAPSLTDARRILGARRRS